jgi:hypothetical protein
LKATIKKTNKTDTKSITDAMVSISSLVKNGKRCIDRFLLWKTGRILQVLENILKSVADWGPRV